MIRASLRVRRPILEEETRRSIVSLLREGHLSAGEIARRLNRRRPALSHHLAILLAARAVECERSGSLRIYRLSEPGIMRAWDEYLSELD